MSLPERISYVPVVEGVDGYLGDDIGEGDHHEGEEQQHGGVEEGVEGEGEQDYQVHPQHHSTHFGVLPVDQKEN